MSHSSVVQKLLNLSTLDLDYKLSHDNWILDDSYQIDKLSCLTPSSPLPRDDMQRNTKHNTIDAEDKENSEALSDTNKSRTITHHPQEKSEKVRSKDCKPGHSNGSTKHPCLSRNSSVGSDGKKTPRISPRSTNSVIQRNIMAVSSGKAKKKSTPSTPATPAVTSSYASLNTTRKVRKNSISASKQPNKEQISTPATVTYKVDTVRSKAPATGSHGINGTPVRRKKFASFSAVPLKTGNATPSTSHPKSDAKKSSSPPRDKVLRGQNKSARARSNTTVA